MSKPDKYVKGYSRTSCRSTFNLASFHSPHCMCWSWCISFQFFRADEGRVWPMWWRHSDNTTRRWGFRVPFIGYVSWQRQINPMPYRDLYIELRDRLDHERYQRSLIPPPPPLGRLNVMDGGASLH